MKGSLRARVGRAPGDLDGLGRSRPSCPEGWGALGGDEQRRGLVSPGHRRGGREELAPRVRRQRGRDWLEGKGGCAEPLPGPPARARGPRPERTHQSGRAGPRRAPGRRLGASWQTGLSDAPTTKVALPRVWACGLHIPRLCLSAGLGLLRNALFAQLMRRGLSNSLLRPVGPGRTVAPSPLPGLRNFLSAEGSPGPEAWVLLQAQKWRLCFVGTRPTQVFTFQRAFWPDLTWPPAVLRVRKG